MKLSQLVPIAGLLLSSALVTSAVPPGQRPAPAQPLRTTEDFAQVKPGGKLAVVCKQCDTVTVHEVASREEAMEYCKEGAEILCPSCEKTFKVARHGPRSKGGTHPETRIVNDRGEECIFVTKLTD